MYLMMNVTSDRKHSHGGNVRQLTSRAFATTAATGCNTCANWSDSSDRETGVINFYVKSRC